MLQAQYSTTSPQRRRTGRGRRLWLALLMLAAVLVALPGSVPASAAVSTTVQSLTAPVGLSDIDCTTTSQCFAVSALGSVTPITITNGTASAGTPLYPNPPEAIEWFPYMGGIGCAGQSACYAVGKIFAQEASEFGQESSTAGGMMAITVSDGTVRNGATRSIDGTSFLYDITCPTARDCYAVGQASGDGLVISIDVDGGWFEPGDVKDVVGATELDGIACPSSTFCYAVGTGPSGGVIASLELVNGSARGSTAQIVPGTTHLGDIACPTASACYVTGNGPNGGLVMSFAVDGTSITPGPIQTLAGTTAMTGIDCVDFSTCYATGEDSSAGVIAQFAVINTSMQTVSEVRSLTAIACPSATCYALGFASVPGQGAVNMLATISPQVTIPTNVTLSSTANPSGYGDAATFVAVVAPTSGTALPGGTVQFAVDGIPYGSPVPVAFANFQNEARITVSGLTAGNHAITATYSGDQTYAGGSAPALAQTVNRAALTIAADNKSMVEGASLPALTWTPSGFVNGDTAAILSGAPNLSTTATTSSAPGDYPITISGGTLSAANYTFSFVEGTFTVLPDNAPPVANAGTDQTVTEGATVTLNGSGSSDPDADALTYAWALIDHTGPAITLSSGTVTSPTFAATDNGSYTFQLTVSDGKGGTDSDEVTITVTNADPSATFSAPASVGEGSPITLSFTAPSDPGSADTAAGFEYAFDCGSGYGTFGSAAAATCPTSDNGTPTVKGQIRDKDGGIAEYTSAITVTNTAPTATFNAPGTVSEGSPITLSLTDPLDPGSADMQAGFDYAFDCGSGYGPFGSSNSATCPASDNGNLAVRGKIRDRDGGIREYTGQVTVSNIAPTLSGVAITPSVDESDTATVSGIISDPGLDDSFTLVIDWGDGTLAATISYPAGTASFSATHQYLDDSPGGTASDSYTVGLTLTDKDGGQDTANTSVTVTNVAPQPEIVGAPNDTPEGTAITLGSDAHDPGPADSFSYAWTVTKDGQPFASANAASISFTPDDNGAYAVSLLVCDDDTGCASTNAAFTVTNVAPVLGGVTGDAINENGAATVTGTISDPGLGDSFTLTIDWGEGAPVEYSYPTGTTSFSESHQYADDNPSETPSDAYSIALALTDKDGGEAQASTSVTVNNVAPTLVSVSVTDATGLAIGSGITAVVLGAGVDLAATFSDAGALDTHTALVDWGDGTTGGTLTEAVGGAPGEFHASHTYASEGSYTIWLTVTDDDTGASAGPSVTVEVVDPVAMLGRVVGDLVTIANQSGSPHLTEALNQLRGNREGKAHNGALDLIEDDPAAALRKIDKAVDEIDAAKAGLSTSDPAYAALTTAQAQLAQVARATAVEQLEAAVASYGDSPSGSEQRQITGMQDDLDAGDAALAAGDYGAAVAAYLDVVRAASSDFWSVLGWGWTAPRFGFPWRWQPFIPAGSGCYSFTCLWL